MARRTYKEAVESIKPVAPEQVLEWQTAIYARLSIENSGKDDKGESIKGQIEICEEYVEEHPYLHLVDVYCDNGWTGTNTNRPEFQRLLNDINNGKIKALVIKDFSRFSRDYIEAGNLLENVFPFMGVRFISVADNYDSFEIDGSAESLLIPLKNLINSYYSKDISKKVSTVVHTKQLAGEHIPSMIPYGYMKSTTREYHFEPGPETVANVTRIFQMRIDKVPLNHIANTFNDESIPSLGKLRYLRGQTSDKRYETSRLALIENLFDKKYTELLDSIVNVFTHSSAIIMNNPSKIQTFFEDLSKVEGRYNDIIGDMFELLVGYYYQHIGGRYLQIRKMIQIPNSTNINEIDVLVERNGEVIIVECKATRSAIDIDFVEKWLTENIIRIRAWLNEKYNDGRTFQFQLWSLGGFASEAMDR